MVHGKLEVEIWVDAASGHVDASSLSVGHWLCFRFFLPKSRAGAAGKPKKKKNVKIRAAIPISLQDPRNQKSQSGKI